MNRDEFFNNYFEKFSDIIFNTETLKHFDKSKDNDFKIGFITLTAIGDANLDNYLDKNFNKEDSVYLKEKIDSFHNIVKIILDFYDNYFDFQTNPDKYIHDTFNDKDKYFYKFIVSFDNSLSSEMELFYKSYINYYNELSSLRDNVTNSLKPFIKDYYETLFSLPDYKELISSYDNNIAPINLTNIYDTGFTTDSSKEVLLYTMLSDDSFFHKFTKVSDKLIDNEYFYQNIEYFNDNQIRYLINQDDNLIKIIENMKKYGLEDKLIYIYKNINYNDESCMVLYDNHTYREDLIKNGLECVLTYLGGDYPLAEYCDIITLDQIKNCFNDKNITEEYYYNFLNKIVSYSGNFPGFNSYDNRLYNELIDHYTKQGNNKILNFIKFYYENTFLIYKDVPLDEILSYFDDNGLCDYSYYDKLILTNDSLYFGTNDIAYLKEAYKDKKYVLNYLDFVHNMGRSCTNFVYDLIDNIDEIHDYYDENGPTKKLFDYIFTKYSNIDKSRYKRSFRKNFLYFANNVKINEFYKDDPAVLKYIKLKALDPSFVRFDSLDEVRLFYGESDVITDELKELYRKYDYEISESLMEFMHNFDVLNPDIVDDVFNIYKNYITYYFFRELPVDKRNERYNYLADNISKKFVFELSELNSNKLNYIIKDPEDLELLFGLFKNNLDKKSLTEDDINYRRMIVSLCRLQFKMKNKDIINTFSNMNSLITHMNDDEFTMFINGISISDQAINLNTYILKIISDIHINREEILESIVECRNLKETSLRNICRKYLLYHEDKYTEKNKNTILKELGMPVKYNFDSGRKILMNYMQKKLDYYHFMDYINELIDGIDLDSLKDNYYIENAKLTKSEILLLLNTDYFDFELINQAFRFKTRPDDKIKNIYSLFKKMINRYIEYKLETIDPNLDIEFPDLNIDTVGNNIELVDYNKSEILKDIDLDIFLNTVCKNKKIYDNFSYLFKSFYLGRLSNSFTDNSLDTIGIDLSCGVNNIGSFITNYYQLLSDSYKRQKADDPNLRMEDIVFNFGEVLNLIFVSNYGNINVIRLIGEEEYKQFISNPGRNAAHFLNSEREDKLANLTNFLYTLDSVTIPSDDIIIENNDKSKKINMIIGNRTNPLNICYGEMTDACMRIGGVGEGLFLKCLTDKNWFHIRLEDPDTHDFISRVSGFRNGNTVFLNQLRDSININKYTNEDLQEFIINYANSLIIDTKDSKYPIKNVFINSQYAFSSASNYKEYSFGSNIQSDYNLNDIKEYCLNSSSDIWTDVRTSAYLIATDEENVDEKLGYVPIEKGPDNTDVYKAVSDKVYGILDYDASIGIPEYKYVKKSKRNLYQKINRVHAMKEKLLGKDYMYEIEDLVTDSDNDLKDMSFIVDGYASSDWYVYLDSNNNIHYDFISTIQKDDKEIDYYNKEEASNNIFKYYNLLVSKYNLNVTEELDIHNTK